MCKCRKVVCPICEHDFMWIENASGSVSFYLYRRKGKNERLISTVCPMCNREIIVPEDLPMGIPVEDETIEVCGSVRGI